LLGSFLTGNIGERVGRFGGRALEKGKAPFKNSLRKGAELTLKKLKETGQTIGPANLTESSLTNFLQQAGEESIAKLPGETTETLRLGALETFQTTAGDIANMLTRNTDVSDIGDALSAMVGSRVNAAKEFGSGLYAEADKATKPVIEKTIETEIKPGLFTAFGTKKSKPVPTEVIKEKIVKGGVRLVDFKKKLIEKAERFSGLSGMVKRVEKMDNIVSFKKAHELRSDLNDFGFVTTDPLGKKSAGAAKDLGGDLTTLMDDAAKELGDDAFDAYKQADKFWKEKAQTFNKKVIKGIIDDEKGAKAFATLIDTKNPNNLAALRNIVMTDPVTGKATQEGAELWGKAQGAWMEQAIFDSLDKKNALSFGSLSKKLTALGSPKQKKGFEELFSINKDSFNNFKEFIDAGADLENKGIKELISIRLTQFGALAGIAASGFALDVTGAGMTVLLGPSFINKAMTNPAISKFLSTGFKVKGTEAEAIKYLSRLSAILSREGIEHRFQQIPVEDKPSIFDTLGNASNKFLNLITPKKKNDLTALRLPGKKTITNVA